MAHWGAWRPGFQCFGLLAGDKGGASTTEQRLGGSRSLGNLGLYAVAPKNITRTKK